MRWVKEARACFPLQGDNKGVLVLVADRKQSAFIGGPSLMRQVGDEMADLVVDGNMTVYASKSSCECHRGRGADMFHFLLGCRRSHCRALSHARRVLAY